MCGCVESKKLTQQLACSLEMYRFVEHGKLFEKMNICQRLKKCYASWNRTVNRAVCARHKKSKVEDSDVRIT